MNSKSAVIFTILFLLTASTSIHAQEGPKIEIFSPQGTVKGIRQASARFSEQMVPFGDPRGLIEPFDINCPEKGRSRWADGKNWIYDFERDLPGGIRCEFNLKPGLNALSGMEITGQKRFVFSTGGPAIRSSNPFGGSAFIDEEQIFILQLDADTDEESILSNASFSIDGIFDHVGVRIISGEEKREIIKTIFGEEPKMPLIVVQARQRFPVDSRVSLIWGKGVMSRSGVPTENDQIFQFKTRGPFTATFHCQRENPEAGCIPISSMYLNFSAPVSWQQASKIILKGPDGKKWKAEGEVQGDKKESVSSIIFKAPFPPDTNLSIEIPSLLTDDANRRLNNADKFPLDVKTDEYPPLAKFPAHFGILELNGSPMLPVTLRNLEPEVKARMLKDIKGKGVIEGIIEEFKGKIFKTPEENEDLSDGILFWLHRVVTANREESVFYGLDKINELKGKRWKTKEFSIPKPHGAKAFEVTGIQLKEPGFYVVEIESEILGGSLFGKDKPMFVPTAVLVTNLSIHFKWGGESSLVWVTSLDKGEPVKDAIVEVRDCEGKLLWKGQTDLNGIARPGRLPPSCPPSSYRRRSDDGLLITARASNDMAFVLSSWDNGIEPWRFQLPYASYGGPLIAHSIFDRTLFRAGETVHMKHILRKHVMDGFSMVPDEKRPKTLLIQHYGSRQKYEFPLNWDSGGVAEAVWEIPKEVKLGLYEAVLGGYPTGRFRVEEFRVPLMKAIIQPPSKPLVSAPDVPVDLTVRYLAGGSAANLPVKLRSLLRPKHITSFSGFDDFIFANGPIKEGTIRRVAGEVYYEEDEEGEPLQSEADQKELKLQSIELKLDKGGGARTDIPNLPKSKMPMEILAELEFKDPNGEIQTVSSTIPLWPAKWLVGIRPDSWALSKDSIKFHVAAVNLSGKPVPEAYVKVDLFERKIYSHRKRLVGGFYSYEHFTEIKRIGALCEGKTDKRGLLICEARSPVSGNIILQAKITDDSGNETVAHRDVWVAGKGEWWFPVEDSDRMDLLPEKKHYEPGETARFQVRMPFREATVLVTLEREGVISSFVKKISGKMPVIEIPIKGNYAPNVFVSVLAIRGRVSGIKPTATIDLGRPAYKLGIAEINVGWKAHELKVNLSPDRSIYKVREKANVKISVKTADGKIPSPGGEVAIAAVDEGLLELMPNKSWQLLDAMMGRRGYEIRTATAQMHVVGKRHFGLKALPHGGGGGKEITRELFDTLLLWRGRLPLDAKGEALIEIPLNDSITSFRIVAIATDETGLFGTGSVSIQSTQDLMVLGGIPPIAREGDRFKAGFTLRNTTERKMDVDVAGRVDRVAEPLKPATLSLSPGEAKEIGWEIIAPVGVDSLIYEVEAKESGGSRDRIKIAQKVVPAVPVRTFQATITQIEKDFNIVVERPSDAIQGRGGINLLLQPTLSDGMAGISEFARRYPYSCLEQKISKAVALRDERLWQQIMAGLPPYIDPDGLAKYFPSMTLGSDVLTSYIIAIAHEAGWEIPKETKERMVSALRRFVEGSLVRYFSIPTADLSIRKIAAIEALSRAGKAEPRLLSSITIEPNLWPTSAVIDWFNILYRVQGIPNREGRINEAEQILRSRLNFQGTVMTFSTERSDQLWWLMVSNDTNSVRLILSLLNLEKWKEDMPRLVRGALGRQKRGAWDLTIANAWGVLAIEKFSKEFEGIPVSGSTRATLSTRSQSLDWNISPKGETITFPWPSIKDNISISHAGTGRPWTTIQSLAAIPLKEPVSSGYKIKKIVIPVEQKDSGRWTKGDIARVRLEMEAQSDMTWAVVNDPIPAGSTILGSGLGRDSGIATRGEEQKGDRDWPLWPGFEERSFEAFRAYYEYIPKGKWAVEYTIRLNNEGIFNLPTTRVEALYSPEMFGELPNQKIEVFP